VKIILVDNFDSFSYNLVHYLEQLNAEITVVNNREVVISSLSGFDACVLSPGPGLPKEAGKLMEVVDFAVKNDQLYNQHTVKHGTTTVLQTINDSILYSGLPTEFKVGLYHSWAVKLKENSPLIATATSNDDVLMSLQHKELPVYAVQYHPESILSENGLTVLKNFLDTFKR
jgi:anthranilate synthase component 2